MDRRIFYALTGRPGCGKTTAILRIVNTLLEKALRFTGCIRRRFGSGGGELGSP
ncbi:MAG: hypothetical protein DRJ43_06260 [Thermoprotei archaeon]|nr:MAG: hypothetical protein DRJ43_06260 [Thermoprotei archaeon]